MRHHKNRIAALMMAALAMMPLPAWPAGTVLVIVNDQPITSFDVDQRLKASEVLGDKPGANARAKVLQELINDQLKRAEAKKLGALPTAKQVDDALNRMARSAGLNAASLAQRFKAKGVSVEDVRDQIAVTMAFNRLLNAKYSIDPKVDPAEVDRKLAQLKNDPRMKGVTVYKIQEIVLPVENVGAMSSQLLEARAIEAQQVMARYKGCSSTRAASQGIFNVQVGKMIEADAARLPKDLKAALDKAGTKRLVGPIPSQGGIQLLGLCGTSSVAPQAPSREQVENLIMNEKYASYEERYVKELRRTAIIDYKDKAYIPKN